MRGALLALALLLPGVAAAEATSTLPPPPVVTLLRLVGPLEDVLIGVTDAEVAQMGGGPPAERVMIALRLYGSLSAWWYRPARGPDGALRYATWLRIPILREAVQRVEVFTPPLAVAPPRGP